MSCYERHLDDGAGIDPEPRPVTVSGIVDNGTIVTVLGRNAKTGKRVYIHFDHRCFATFWADWLARGSPQPIMWNADAGVVSFADGGDDG